MLLTVDIGNSNIVCGSFKGQELAQSLRLKTDPFRTRDEYRALLLSLWSERFGQSYEFSKVVISSVVPNLTTVFSTLIGDLFGLKPLIIGPGIKTGLSIRTSDPAAVGADRVVNAVAAKEFYGVGAIVIDFGTATSFDVIDQNSNYLGGVIAPGLEISLDALVSRTAKLPRIDLVWPERVVGSDTISAMQSGCMIGYVCLVEGVVERIKTEVVGISNVIATGGLAHVIAEHTPCINQCSRDLTLHGMRVIADMNCL